MSQPLRDRPPFTQTPDWVALAPISAQAFRIYVLLAGHVNQSRDDADVWPTHAQLAAMMGLAKPDAIRPYVDELVEIGAISRTTIRTHGGMRQRNRYTVRGVVPAGWDGASSIAEFHDRQREKSQFTPSPPNLGGSGPPQKGSEPDQHELDEYEPDQPANGPAANSASEPGSGAVEETGGWMEVENGHQTPTTQPSAGEQLLAHVERRNAATLTAQRGEHVRTVDAALDVLPRDQVQAVLGDGLDRASSPSGALVARVRSLPEQARQYREQREEQRRRHEQRERALNDREDRKRAERDAAKPAAAASDEVQQAAMDQMRQLLANQKGTTQVRGGRKRSVVPRARGTAS